MTGRWPRLRRLCLNLDPAALGEGTAAALAGLHLLRLDDLCIVYNNETGDAGEVQAVLEAMAAARCPQLRALYLYVASAEHVAAFAAADYPELRELTLETEEPEHLAPSVPVTPSAAAALAAAHFPKLEMLDVTGFHGLGDGGTAALAAAAFPELRTVALHQITPLGAAALARANWPRLHKLEYNMDYSLHYAASLGDVAVRLAAGQWLQLESLWLHNCGIGDAGAAAMAAAAWPALRHLSLRENDISEAGAATLAAAA